MQTNRHPTLLKINRHAQILNFWDEKNIILVWKFIFNLELQEFSDNCQLQGKTGYTFSKTYWGYIIPCNLTDGKSCVFNEISSTATLVLIICWKYKLVTFCRCNYLDHSRFLYCHITRDIWLLYNKWLHWIYQ
jgi:hypothetical protein